MMRFNNVYNHQKTENNSIINIFSPKFKSIYNKNLIVKTVKKNILKHCIIVISMLLLILGFVCITPVSAWTSNSEIVVVPSGEINPSDKINAYMNDLTLAPGSISTGSIVLSTPLENPSWNVEIYRFGHLMTTFTSGKNEYSIGSYLLDYKDEIILSIKLNGIVSKSSIGKNISVFNVYQISGTGITSLSSNPQIVMGVIDTPISPIIETDTKTEIKNENQIITQSQGIDKYIVGNSLVLFGNSISFVVIGIVVAVLIISVSVFIIVLKVIRNKKDKKFNPINESAIETNSGNDLYCLNENYGGYDEINQNDQLKIITDDDDDYDFIFCTNCGKKLNASAKYCPKCNNKIK